MITSAKKTKARWVEACIWRPLLDQFVSFMLSK